MIFGKNSDPIITSRKFAHEVGHQGGATDYYQDISERPLQIKDILMTNQFGIKIGLPVGELMESSVPTSNRLLSDYSIKKMIGEALKTAFSLPENKVTLLSGGMDIYNDSKDKIDGIKSEYKPTQKIISKSND
jgi:hypothetical protein